jgi:hypothetical protein
MSPVAETGKAVGGFFEVMRQQPLSLALVVMNFALLAYIFWSGKETMGLVYKSQAESQALLAKCIVLDTEELLKKIK